MPTDTFLDASYAVDMFLKHQGGFRTIVYGKKWSTPPAALFAISLKTLVFIDVTTEILAKIGGITPDIDEFDKLLRCMFISELLTGEELPDKRRRLQQKTRKNLSFLRSVRSKINDEIAKLRSEYDPIEQILPSSLRNALHPTVLPRFVRMNTPYIRTLYGRKQRESLIISEVLTKQGVREIEFPALEKPNTFSFDPLIESVLCFNNKFDSYHNTLIKDNVLITQSRSSCLPVKCVEELLRTSEVKIPVVLDACAAPGSKTLQLAASDVKMKIIANDRDSRRIKILMQRLVDCHITGNKEANNVDVMCCDFSECDDITHKGKYDVILTDVSCSGSGSTELDMCLSSIHFKTDGEQEIRLKGIIINQKAVLRKALTLSKRHVVYSTCSDDIREDEEVVNAILSEMNKEEKQWEVVCVFNQWPERGISKPEYVFDAKKCLRSTSKQYTDGFFVCALSRITH